MFTGLHTSGTHSAYVSERSRRRVLYQYANGAAPLTYLMSLMPEEETDKTQFGWWEERDTIIKSTTAMANAAGPFTNTAGVDLTVAGWNAAVGTNFRVYLADVTVFRVQDGIWIRNVPNGAANATLDVKAVVTAQTITDAVTGAGYLTVNPVEAVTSISNDTDANAIEVYFYSSAAAEGTKSKAGSYSFPIEVTNYTQIFKHGITITRSALKQGIRYDKSGVWQDKMKKTGLRHSKALEFTALRGVRGTRNVQNEDGDTVPERLSGGIEYYLRQWELGNITNGGIADYRPGGSSVIASAWEATDDKRIIPLSANITVDQFDKLLERAFRFTTETNFEKICVCGSGFIKAIQTYCKIQSMVMREMNTKDTFGLQVYRLETIYGTLLLKSHPLLSQDSNFRNDAYIIDPSCLHWRPLTDSDTQFLEGREGNDFDGRKDCWLTEGGYEIWFPENHMHIKNLTGITA